MKRLGAILIAGAALLLTLNSCKKIVGEGPVVTEERTVSNFTAIHSKISSDVYYSTGADYKVEIQAQKNIIDVIETYVNGNELQIKFQNDVNIKSHEAIRVNVTAPDVNSFTQSGSGNLFALNDLATTSLQLRISGSGDIKLGNVVTTGISSQISGSGTIQVAQGTADHVSADISGSGNIDLVNVMSKNGNTTTSGSGGIKIYATENLTTKISGSGTVWYRGNPKISTQISGSGRVVPY